MLSIKRKTPSIEGVFSGFGEVWSNVLAIISNYNPIEQVLEGVC